MGQREDFIEEQIISNLKAFGEGWGLEAVREQHRRAWPFQSSYGIGLGEHAAAEALRRAKQQAILAEHVLAQVKEQAVFALLSEEYPIRDVAAALDLPKSEVGRIAKSLGGERGKPNSHATASPLAMQGGTSAVGDWVVAAWGVDPQAEPPRPIGADLRPTRP